jgi:hypothetical protein
MPSAAPRDDLVIGVDIGGTKIALAMAKTRKRDLVALPGIEPGFED